MFLIATSAGCGGSQGALNGRFVIEPMPSRGDFANESALVRKADAQITQLLGHPVSFHFDAAIVPRWAAQLEVFSEGAIDAVAHELAEIKRITPDLFAWMAPNLVCCLVPRLHPRRRNEGGLGGDRQLVKL